MRIVLDTNCLLASLSKRGAYFNVWRGLQEGKYTLCVSNEVLEEYEEIIGQKDKFNNRLERHPNPIERAFR